jgi:hypothetical protein
VGESSALVDGILKSLSMKGTLTRLALSVWPSTNVVWVSSKRKERKPMPPQRVNTNNSCCKIGDKFTIWITQYAAAGNPLDNARAGIIKDKVEVKTYYMLLWVFGKKWQGPCSGKGKDWFLTKNDAVKNAIVRCNKRIANLHKDIDKAKKLKARYEKSELC